MNYSEFFNNNYYDADEEVTSGDIATVDAPLGDDEDDTYEADGKAYVDFDPDEGCDPAYEDDDDPDVCPDCGRYPCVCGESDDIDPDQAYEDDDEDEYYDTPHGLIDSRRCREDDDDDDDLDDDDDVDEYYDIPHGLKDARCREDDDIDLDQAYEDDDLDAAAYEDDDYCPDCDTPYGLGDSRCREDDDIPDVDECGDYNLDPDY